jgi:hypothetical protein
MKREYAFFKIYLTGYAQFNFTTEIMFHPPPIIELLFIAAIGARGWFISVALFGLVLLAQSLGVNVEVEPRAVVFAFFMPLIAAAIMGTVALGTYRARSEAWGVSSMRKQVFLAAFVWNGILGFATLVMDRVVLYFQLLPREPFEFLHAVAVVAAMSAGLALLSVFPRQGPQ